MINGISDRGLWGSKTDFRSVGVYKMKGAEKDEYYRCTCEKSCKRSRKAADGEYRDIAHPINSTTRDRIQTLILDKYQEVMNETDAQEEAAEE